MMAQIDGTHMTDAERAEAVRRYVAQLETERDALAQQISEWREAVERIIVWANDGLVEESNSTMDFRQIRNIGSEILTRYPMKLDDAPGTDEQS